MGEFSKLKWMTAVRTCKGIKSADRKLAILHIGDTANADGMGAWRSNQKVADELDMSVDTVKRARGDAVRHGLMVVSRPAPRGAGNTKTTEYQLIMPSGNGGTRAPISDAEIGARVHGNGGTRAPEIGAPVHPPSGIASGIASGVGDGETHTVHNPAGGTMQVSQETYKKMLSEFS